MADVRADPTDSKVGRLIETYGFDGFGDELEARWTADEDDDSLRTLARAFNLELLQRATTDVGLDLLDGEIESLYEALTDDSATGAERTRTRGRLERAGVDIDQLQKDFVSHQAIHTYLTSYRGASKARRQSDPTERVQRLRGRLVAVTESALESLEHRETLEIGSADVLVDIQVLCTECGRQYGFDELIHHGSCGCSVDE
ncbi:rod-determining factor RdfA [Haloferax sp. DFSO60]|uniref:rod-determining factor RdfA n=1 Tax=Haloferax sp. DFSO60 TaxID=3388652 RepID=UPI003977FB43